MAGYNGIALLGTNFSTDLMKLLSGKSIAMWLDEDAVQTAAKYARNYRIFFKEFKIIVTLYDPKDLSIESIHEALQ